MNWSLFIGTFCLIFVAELGDKTQLAVMSQSANASSRWTIFFAGALALTLSTAIGVLAGSVLNRFVSPRVLKLAGGALFLLFGVLMLREGLNKAELKATPETARVEIGVLGRFLLARAAEFERAAFTDYRLLAEKAESPRARRLFEELAVDEETHFARLTKLSEEHALDALDHPLDEQIAAEDALRFDVAEADRPPLQHAIEHERATAAFYLAFAKASPIPEVKHTLTALANAELLHVKKLEDILNG